MNKKGMTERLLKRLQKHSQWTYMHSIRVKDYSIKTGQYLGMRPQELELLAIAASLHDIGKMAVPVNILDKTTALTEKEYRLVKCHTIYGYLFLKSEGYPLAVCEAVRDHHERYDGKGYGEKEVIGISAKIICAVDAYDAMKFGRPYRDKMTMEEIYQDIAQNSGKQFEPDVCAAVLESLF